VEEMGCMRESYDFINRAGKCYRLLQDELSRKIFWARLRYDFGQSSEDVSRIVKLGEHQKWLDTWVERLPNILDALVQNHKKLVLYGTNITGQTIATLLKKRQIDFYGFCGRRAKAFPQGLMGKPVILPEYLFQHPDEFYVVPAVEEARDEIFHILREHDFPPEQIFDFIPSDEEDHQYFEFPSLFPRGTAFVDGGCLDCRSSYIFADWCEGAYTKIFAFEPDPISYSICKQKFEEKKIRDFYLIPAGLSDHDGNAIFQTGLYGNSHITGEENFVKDNVVSIPVTTIDGTVGKETVGFIKMDIEGSEFDALHGAKRVITRDKPLVAISVYHRIGDMFAIMDYLYHLVPAYHFWLRHYSIGVVDTVLYASVDLPDEKS